MTTLNNRWILTPSSNSKNTCAKLWDVAVKVTVWDEKLLVRAFMEVRRSFSPLGTITPLKQQGLRTNHCNIECSCNQYLGQNNSPVSPCKDPPPQSVITIPYGHICQFAFDLIFSASHERLFIYCNIAGRTEELSWSFNITWARYASLTRLNSMISFGFSAIQKPSNPTNRWPRIRIMKIITFL